MSITILPERVAALDTIQLDSGAHSAAEVGKAMCAMEAVAWIAGEPHTDHPQCASPVISAFMRSWNDGLAVEDRNRLLKPFLTRLVGSRGSAEQERARSLMALDWHNGVMLPAFLDLVEGLKPHAVAVRADHLNPVVVRASSKASSAARAAAGDAAGDAAWAAAWDAARAAAWAAAGDAAGDAAGAAAGDAARAAAGAAARAAARAAAGAAARAAAWDAARAVLAPVVSELQVSALDLLDRMLKVTEAEVSA